jgi:hypothetical protein
MTLSISVASGTFQSKLTISTFSPWPFEFRWHQVGARREEAVRELDGDLASCPFPAWFSVSFHCVLWKAVFWEIRSRGIDLEGFFTSF